MYTFFVFEKHRILYEKIDRYRNRQCIRQKKWKTTTFKETNGKHTANRLQNTLQENNRDTY